MKVRDIMTTQVQWVARNTSLVEAAQMMAQQDFGSVPVCEGDRLLGMVTDRDIVVRCVAKGQDCSSTTVDQVMSKPVHSVTPDTDVHQASDLMAQQQVRRLPVEDNGRLVGIVALGDMAVEQIHINEAGDALSDISQGVHH